MMKLVLMSLTLIAAASSALAQESPPAPPTTSLVFEEVAGIAPAIVVGETPIGRRQSVAITGGTVSGPGLTGRILPGGADYQLVRSDGAVTIDADYMIETDDHVTIHVRNVGIVVPPAKDRPAYAWAAPRFDAPAGRYGWLNSALFISRISRAGDAAHPAVRITVWKVG
jgi:hypothetical protein